MSKENQRSAIAKLLSSPAVYLFDFKDVPLHKYAETLDILFRNPDFIAGVDKRNRMVRSASKCKSGSSEINALIKVVQQNDRKLADAMYAAIVQTNIHSEVGLEYLSFSDLMHYYVDYSQADTRERVKRLTANLYKVTFLADMLESVVVDVNADMREVFGKDIQFKQFDGVSQVLKQLRTFFKSVRPQTDDTPEAQLYLEYSDSINDYLAKRLKTYVDKFNKMHPEYVGYTDEDVVGAINLFFSTDIFTSADIAHSATGCPYVDLRAISQKLDAAQTMHFEKLLNAESRKDQTYQSKCYMVTDIIVRRYKHAKK